MESSRIESDSPISSSTNQDIVATRLVRLRMRRDSTRPDAQVKSPNEDRHPRFQGEGARMPGERKLLAPTSKMLSCAHKPHELL